MTGDVQRSTRFTGGGSWLSVCGCLCVRVRCKSTYVCTERLFRDPPREVAP